MARPDAAQRVHLRHPTQGLGRFASIQQVERRCLSKVLLPHVKAFYAGYFDPERHQPFYRPSSRA